MPLGRILPILLCALATIVLWTAPSWGIDPPEALVRGYMRIKQGEALLKTPEVAQDIPEVTELKRHKFYRGNPLENVLEKLVDEYIQDHFHDIANWWSCIDWKPEGVCYKCTWLGCSFKMYISYYFPVQNFELVSAPLTSEYLAEEFVEVLESQNLFDLKDIWHESAKKHAPHELKRVADELDIDDLDPAEYDLKLDNSLQDLFNANTPEQMEWRVMSTLAQLTRSFFIPQGECHSPVSNIFPPYSEMPHVVDFTRRGELQDLIFMIPMWTYKWKNGLLPSYHIGTNLLFGLGPLQTVGQLSDPIPNPMADPHIGTEYGGTHMSGNEYTKKWVTQMLRASHFNLFFPSIFPFIKNDRGERKPSRYQWLHPEGMPKGCEQKIASTPYGSYGSFLNTTYNPEIDRQDEGRGIMTQWQWFRCCPSGYQVFPGLGDEPQYKY